MHRSCWKFTLKIHKIPLRCFKRKASQGLTDIHLSQLVAWFFFGVGGMAWNVFFFKIALITLRKKTIYNLLVTIVTSVKLVPCFLLDTEAYWSWKLWSLSSVQIIAERFRSMDWMHRGIELLGVVQKIKFSHGRMKSCHQQQYARDRRNAEQKSFSMLQKRIHMYASRTHPTVTNGQIINFFMYRKMFL